MESKLVNWQNGMMLSADNLRSIEDYFIESNSVYCGYLKNANYWGVAEPIEYESLISVYESANKKLYISVSSSVHISKGGLLLEIPAGETVDIVTEQLSDNVKIDRYGIVLSGNIGERSVYGGISVDEEPARVPWSRIKLGLSLVPFENLNCIGYTSTIVGVIKRSAGTWSVDLNYIVPSIKMLNIQTLVADYNNMVKSYDRIIKLSGNIIDKIYIKGNGYSLADNMLLWLMEIISFMESERFGFMSIGINYHPFKLRLFFSRFSGMITAFLKKISTEHRRELLDYINEWCLIPPGIFMQVFDAVNEIDYNHWNISFSIYKINDMLRTLVVVLEKLGQLEFVGQHKESIIIS